MLSLGNLLAADVPASDSSERCSAVQMVSHYFDHPCSHKVPTTPTVVRRKSMLCVGTSNGSVEDTHTHLFRHGCPLTCHGSTLHECSSDLEGWGGR